MPKKNKKPRTPKKGKSADTVPEYASDDETLYGTRNDPDPDSREYFYDDIDEFHAHREKVLLEKSYKPEERVTESDEEEVLDLDSEDSDDEEIRNLKAQLRRVKQEQRKYEYADDIEEQSEEEDDTEKGLPDDKAWGARRSRYYGDDDIDLRELEEDDAEAVLEEKEARRLQKQMAEQLEEDDFGLDVFKKSEKSEEKAEKEDKIVKDLSKLSKKEKLQLLKKESPELLTLIADFKDKLLEAQEKLCPLRQLIEKKNLSGKAADYVNTKLKLTLNYCTNIAFYLMLKSKQVPVHNHPVIKRLLQYKNILKQLEPLDQEISEEVDDILSKLKDGKDVVFDTPAEVAKPFVRKPLPRKKGVNLEKKRKLAELVSDSEDSDSEELTVKHKNKKQASSEQYETRDEVEALKYYQMMKDGRPDQQPDDDLNSESNEEEPVDEEEEGMDGKRAINYQIEKNKGLTAHKKKELRNPRVKHRMKFRKAKIRRKGQFREPRTEMQRYGGEISGIRAGVKRGIKLK